jgi:ankyrin repeat protein
VNVVDEHGMSALHFAANAGHLEVVNVLLAANADVNAVDEVIYATID